MLRRPARRALAGAGVALTLAVSATVALGGTPAASAPAEDCAVPYPVADLGRGAAVRGLTVTSGTSPQSFTGEVLGVITDGIAPGIDMVMVKVDPTGLDVDRDEVQGIWQGMSGSPVYAADGRLIGAVAYGLAGMLQSWVAGVTPFEDMDDYLATRAPAKKVRVDDRTAARVADAAGISRAQASSGFAPLPTPLAVSGVPARFLNPSAEAVAKHPWLRTDTYVAGKAAASVGAETIVAGGNIAAAASYGDIAMASVGTATSVCNGDVVGFGHPAGFYGETTMTLHPAEAIYVQGSVPSFKVANIGEPVGTVFGDHTTGITGRFGALPDTVEVTSQATWGTRSRTGTTHISLDDPSTLTYVTYLQTAMNHSVVIDGAVRGSEVFTWTVDGSDADGTPFSLSWTDRLQAEYDLSDEAGMAAAGVLESLAALEDVTVDSVDYTAAAGASVPRYRLARVEQYLRGAWTKVGQRRPAVARAGARIKVRAVFRAGAGREVQVPFSFAVPRGTGGKTTQLVVVGGESTFLDPGTTVDSFTAALAKGVRNDQVRAQFGRIKPADIDYNEYDYEFDGYFEAVAGRNKPGQVSFLRTQTTEPGAAIMRGVQQVPVTIRH